MLSVEHVEAYQMKIEGGGLGGFVLESESESGVK